MRVQKKHLYLLFLALITSGSYGDEATFLKTCRSDEYNRLIQEDKIFTAIATRLSQKPPYQCLSKYEQLKRFIAIESTDYFSKSVTDQQYRTSIDVSVDDRRADETPISIYSNLSINEANNTDTGSQKINTLTFLPGYGVMKGVP